MAVAVIIAVTVDGRVPGRDRAGRVAGYNSSKRIHALTTVGQLPCLAGLLRARLGGAAPRTLARAASMVFLSAFSVVTLAMPLDGPT